MFPLTCRKGNVGVLSNAADTARTAVGNGAHTAVKSTGSAPDSAGNSIGNRAKDVTQ
jgi:hypothetical protein